MSRPFWPLVAVMTAALAMPAAAQTVDRDDNVPSGGLARNQAECIAQFQEADLNGDGFLSAREIGESRSLLPTELSGEDRISRQHFVSVCNARAESNQPG